ncbi:MAG: NDP-sugar synthase, partial [Caldimicrobium sp.]
MEIKAFILAAGYGTRLRPLTYFLPKPLLPLLGKPLLYYILKNLNKNNIPEIGINLHHLGEKIEAYLRDISFSQKIKIFYEREILGTGGALKNAESFLRDAPFLVHNGDIWTNFELKRLIDFHIKEKPIATLLVLENFKENKLYIDEEGRLLGLEGYLKPQKFAEKVSFSGIAIYEPEILEYLERSFSSIVTCWLKALESGKEIRTLKLEGSWFDLGSFFSYWKAISFFLKEKGERVFFHPEAEVGDLEFNGFVSVESRTFFKKGSFLRNVVVLAQDKIISENYEEGILVGEKFIPIERIETTEEIGLGGSERKFFRKRPGFVLMKAFKYDEEEFKRIYRYNYILREGGVRIPNIKKIFQDRGEILFE